MIDVTFTFNGFDLAPYLSTFSVVHERETVESLITMDGTEHVATRVRPTIRFSLIPLTDAQSQNIYTALSTGTASTSYTDTYIGERTATMRVASSLESVFGIRSVDGNRYYKGGAIVLRQRTVL